MRFNVTINQDRCIKNGLNVNQAALMTLFNELPSWASEKIINGQTYWHLSRNKVIAELPLFYKQADTVYRHFKDLNDLKMIEYVQDKRQDYVRLTIKGKLWNKLGNESEFASNSEMNPRKLGNESEFVKEVNVVDAQEVSISNSEMNPTYNIYNNTIHDREEKALAFLERNAPSIYQNFLMRFRKFFTEDEFKSFCEKFDATVVLEVSQRKLEFVVKQIDARLLKFVLSYTENMAKNNLESKIESTNKIDNCF